MRPAHFRFKTAEPGSNKEWQCCLCLHVRTATILLGMWHMVLHILALCIMVALLNNPSLIVHDTVQPPRTLTQIQFGSDQNTVPEFESESQEISKNLLELGPTRRPDYEILRKQMTRYTDIQSGILVTFCTMLMTMGLVMGALRGKPSLMMPFFCFQLFDFCIGCLAAMSYLTVLDDVHRIVASSQNVPFQNVLLEMNPQCLTMVIILSFALAMFIKGYFIRVVWKCYKFLVLKHTTRHSIHVIEAPYDSQNLLPDYDSAVNKYQSPMPPPSYDIATQATHAPPSYNVAMAAQAGLAVPPQPQQGLRVNVENHSG